MSLPRRDPNRLEARTKRAGARGKFGPALWALGLMAAAACTPYGGSVTRVVDGKTRVGRYIPLSAYADFALGAYLEETGAPEQAEAAYTRALADDPYSPEMWRRLGRLRCARDPKSGMSAVARALKLDPNYEPAWRARAQCLLGAGDLQGARSAAEEAFRLDPNQEQVTLLLARIFVAQRAPLRARTWLGAWVVRHPSSGAAWKALAELARQTGDAALLQRAERALSARSQPALPPPTPNPRALDPLDRALTEQDLKKAQRAGVALRLTPAEVGLRAYQRGQSELARTQAQLVLGADPTNSDARLLLLLLGDASAAQDLWAEPEPLSPSFAKLLAEQIQRAMPAAE